MGSIATPEARITAVAAAVLGGGVLAVGLALGGPEELSDVKLRSGGRELDSRWRLVDTSLLLACAWSARAEEFVEAVVSLRDGSEVSVRVESNMADLARLLRTLAELPEDGRRQALDFLALAGPPCANPTFDKSMNAARALLRERLPLSIGERSEIRSAVLDAVVECGGGMFYLRGWTRDAIVAPKSVTAVSPHGGAIDLLRDAVWEDRPLVDAYFDGSVGTAARGFSCLVQLDSAPTLGEWLVELRDDEGAVESAPLAPTRDIAAAQELILRDLVEDRIRTTGVQNAVTAIERIQASASRPVVECIHTFGDVPSDCDVSLVVVVPDPALVEHHLAAYATDPDMLSVDVIFVVGSAESELLVADAPGLHELYRVPFRLVVLGSASADSFAGAASCGVESSSGRLVVLATGDTVPAAEGWLARLIEAYEAHPEAAIVGGTVLRVDGRVDAAGVDILMEGRAAVWRPREAGVLRRTLSRAPHPVDGIEGCVLMSAEALSEAGGLAGSFLDARSELFALCLRLTAAGGGSAWCVPAAEFYNVGNATAFVPSDAVELYHSLLLGSLLDESDEIGLSAWVDELVVARDSPLLSASLRAPTEAESVGGHGLTVAGHALAAAEPVNHITVRFADIELARTIADVATPQVAEASPEIAHAALCGFRVPISLLGLPEQFDLQVEAEAASGERLSVGAVRGRRRRLSTNYCPDFEPLFVTTLGRTGSSWLMLLLSQHPELVAYLPFRFEPRVSSYWLAVARALAEPRSYLQAIDPELSSGHWWLGEGRTPRRAAAVGQRRIPDWLGSSNVNAIANFAQSQIDSFYCEVADSLERRDARFFVEKRFPSTLTDALATELYPDSREIFLIRDLRDVACSSLSFSSRRGAASFGRELAKSDEEYLEVLRSYASLLLRAWRERGERSLLVRYEDLIRAPEAELERIFAYVGIDHRPGTIAEVVSSANGSERQGQEEHRTADSPAASVGRWRRDLPEDLKRVAHESLGDLLNEFGYSSDESLQS